MIGLFLCRIFLAIAFIALPMMAVAPGLAEHLTQGARHLQDYFASAPQVPSWLAGLPIVGARLARTIALAVSPPARASARVGAENRAAATRQWPGSPRTGSPC